MSQLIGIFTSIILNKYILYLLLGNTLREFNIHCNQGLFENQVLRDILFLLSIIHGK